MYLSKACQYAILAMLYLADQGAGRLRSIREISEGTGAPAPFLGKIVSNLSRAGLVAVRRGPKGGASLGRTPDQVTIGAIVAAIEGAGDGRECLLGLPECSDDDPCPVHDSWRRLQRQLNTELHALSLAELAQTHGMQRLRRAP